MQVEYVTGVGGRNPFFLNYSIPLPAREGRNARVKIFRYCKSSSLPTAIHHRCALRIPLRKIEGYRPICFSRVLLHETYAEYFKRVKKHNRRNGKKHVKETIRKKEETTIIGIDCRWKIRSYRSSFFSFLFFLFFSSGWIKRYPNRDKERKKKKRETSKYLFTAKIKSNGYLLSNRQLLDNKCGKVSSG